MNPLLLSVGGECGPAFQALAHNGLASHAQEWHQEWQRAQARAWLHATPEPGVPPDRTAASHGDALEYFGVGAPVPDAFATIQHPAVQAVRPSSVSAPTGTVAMASYPPSRPQGSTSRNEHASPELPPQPGIASGGKPATRQAPCQRETVHRTLQGAPESRTEKDTLRLHVECADDGLRVWIGADGDAAAVSARAAAILAELRRPGHVSFLALASVVCNGRTLYASAQRTASPLENPP